MATTCKLIAKSVLGSDAANIEFTSIPGTGYTDLLLLLSLRSDRAASISDTAKLRFNGASADTSHSCRLIQGAGSAGVGSYTLSYAYAGEAPCNTATASTFNNTEIYIPNYAGSTNKSYSATDAHETNGTQAYISAMAGLWSSTDAITAIKVLPLVGSNWKSGSSAYLYGITKA